MSPPPSTPRWQALADQDSLMSQDLDGVAEATAIQDANVDQSGGGAVAS